MNLNALTGMGRVGRRERRLIKAAVDVGAAAHDAVCVTNPENRFIHANAAFERLYGWVVSSLVGKSPRVLLSSRCPAGTEQHVLEATFQGGWTGRIANVDGEGHELLVDLRTTAIRGDGDSIVAMLGFAEAIPCPPPDLSPRQLEIYECLGRSMVVKEIGALLGITSSTVETQIRRMIRKLPDVRDIIDLQCHAVRYNARVCKMGAIKPPLVP